MKRITKPTGTSARGLAHDDLTRASGGGDGWQDRKVPLTIEFLAYCGASLRNLVSDGSGSWYKGRHEPNTLGEAVYLGSRQRVR